MYAPRSRLAFAGALLGFVLAAGLLPAQGGAPPVVARIDVDVAARRLIALGVQGDTLHVAPIAVGSGAVLAAGDSVWRFATPVGVTEVVAREVAPDWIPPDWHYIEVARKYDLRFAHLRPEHPVILEDGTLLAVRGWRVGLIAADAVFRELPHDEEIIFDGVLYAPPFGTPNRRVAEVLGPYRLRLANGIDLHGTIFPESIGEAVTHGCIRLSDEDITWLYRHTPLGARVVLF